uniref:Uncharacterized protein n=1 Tax=Siphoviridae sp. ctnsL8 TaxID=2825666 RepID=A0A8S5PNE8_9CAUD|nr:MAG TPA: hypothetical protein [Siphoviridae sp. ctnsL8]
MKIELQNGDRITIPEGCRAQINGNEVVIEKEKKEEVQEFKDGDVLTSLFDNKVVFIFKEDESKQKYNKNDYYVCHTADYVIDVPTKDSLSFCGHKDDVRLATNEEKQLLFDKMKEQGLRWNAEEKRVEKIRWRAKKGEAYCRMGLGGGVFYEIDRRTDADNVFYDTLNYFHTEEQTKEAARRVKEVLRKFHEEIGE